MFSSGGDEATLNMAAVKERADIMLDGGQTLEMVRQEVAALLIE